jgi:cardiolipin synthase
MTAASESTRYALRPHAMQSGNHVDVLVDGQAAYPAMLAAIAAAKREIHLEVYIWNSDASGMRFVEAVKQKARTGVMVRAIIDAVGSFAMSADVRQGLREAGVQLAEFNPLSPWRARWGWSVRDHRKLLVVDGETAFLGGLNLGDDYAPASWGGRAWHDVHARIRGPAVRDLERLFWSSWRHADGPDTVGRLLPAGPPPPGGNARVQVLAVGSRRDRRQIQRACRYALKRATARILIEAAYFIPDRGLRRVLGNAAKRGVDVRLMLPHTSDLPAVQHASRHVYAQLLRHGVRIFEWVPTMLHAKTMLVDDAWCAIGSSNLDRRSVAYNWELMVAVEDVETCRALEATFLSHMASCIEVKAATWAHRGLWPRILEQVFYWFRRWL